MAIRGRVKNGVVVLESADDLPEGTEVTVRPVKARRKPAAGSKRRGPLRKGLLRFAGKAEGLPADAARQLDHYLYGHPKQ